MNWVAVKLLIKKEKLKWRLYYMFSVNSFSDLIH